MSSHIATIASLWCRIACPWLPQQAKPHGPVAGVECTKCGGTHAPSECRWPQRQPKQQEVT